MRTVLLTIILILSISSASHAAEYKQFANPKEVKRQKAIEKKRALNKRTKYNNPNVPKELNKLREFRDMHLVKFWAGRMFRDYYYAYGPITASGLHYRKYDPTRGVRQEFDRISFIAPGTKIKKRRYKETYITLKDKSLLARMTLDRERLRSLVRLILLPLIYIGRNFEVVTFLVKGFALFSMLFLTWHLIRRKNKKVSATNEQVEL